MPLYCTAAPTAFAAAALLLSAAYGQSAGERTLDRVFDLAHTETMQDFQEIATALRMVADLRPISADSAQRSLTVGGPADEIALAEWLINEFGKPSNGVQGQRQDMREYRLPGADVVRVIYLHYAQTPQDLQEIPTILRTTTDVRRLYVSSARKALTLRGAVDQIELAQWVVDELGKSQHSGAQSQGFAAREYRTAPGDDELVQISYLTHAERPQEVQEIGTTLRTVANVRRLFTFSRTRALIMRGPEDQMVLSRWLISELDQPANRQDSGTHEYLPPETSDVVRVFYLSRLRTPQELQEVATLIRAEAGIRQLFVYNATNAITLRSTADRVARAESLIKERNEPNAR